MTKPQDLIKAYHQRSKHHLQRYAAGPETLDWDSQPNPFRRFVGAAQIALPLLKKTTASVTFTDLYRPEKIKPAEWSLQSVATLLELGLGLSAWKQYGSSRWSLRCNPSSGNLHPTEGYLVCHDLPALAAGVYHYACEEHLLEQRGLFQQDLLAKMSQLLPPNSLLLGLSSIAWREAWKYGERAFRYVQLDIGHAIAAVRYAAASLGWQAQVLETWSDQQVATLLGLDRPADFSAVETEQPDLVMAISPKPLTSSQHVSLTKLIDLSSAADWSGKANLLDPKPMYQWPVIDEVSEATSKPFTTSSKLENQTTLPPVADKDQSRDAVELIKQRRSAQAFDGKTAISNEHFYHLLDMLLPRQQTVPWDSSPFAPRVHPVLFLHRVEGLSAGLYALPRSDEAKTLMQHNMRQDFAWQKPGACPSHIPLYLLVKANCQNAARTIACHQDIASDSAFSLALLAEFDSALKKEAWSYRNLYWEAGMMGQVLYLEAEAIGLRGTGIGCYFDDAMHDTLGIGNTALQDMYHFTVGGPVVDQRLISLPAYGHLSDRN